MHWSKKVKENAVSDNECVVDLIAEHIGQTPNIKYVVQ